MTKKKIDECKAIIAKLHDAASWLEAFVEAYQDIEQAEKLKQQFSPNPNQILAIKTALASQILIRSLAISEGSGRRNKSKIFRKDDQNFGVLQVLLRDRKINNYFCEAVVNKTLARMTLRNFKQFNSPKLLARLRNKQIAHITSKNFLKGYGKKIYQHSEKVRYQVDQLHRLVIKKK